MSLWITKFNPALLSQLLSKPILMVLVLLLSWQLGDAVSRYLEQPSTLLLPNFSATPAETSKRSSVQTIQNDPFYLLGRQAPIQTASKSTASEPVTVSKLNLKVLGILALSGDRGVAIIKSGSKTVLVAKGEKIQSGVTLEAIYPDYIVVNHNGVLEKLVMVSKNTLFDSSLPSKVSSNTESSAKLAVLSKELKRSPMKITQYVRFQLMNRGGKVSAIKVWPKKDKALFNALGFQAGDVLKKVNGHSISEMMNTPALWQKLLNETTFQMDVERQGNLDSFVVNLD